MEVRSHTAVNLDSGPLMLLFVTYSADTSLSHLITQDQTSDCQSPTNETCPSVKELELLKALPKNGLQQMNARFRHSEQGESFVIRCFLAKGLDSPHNAVSRGPIMQVMAIAVMMIHPHRLSHDKDRA